MLPLCSGQHLRGVNFITRDRARFPAPVAAILLPLGLAFLCPGREKRSTPTREDDR
jgi:hypothetical protein